MNDALDYKLAQRDIKPTAMRILVLQHLMEQNKAISLQTIESAFDIADKPSLAVNTLYPSLERLYLRISNISGSSSTQRIVISDFFILTNLVI